MTTTIEIDDIVCDIEDLRYEPERASEVAFRVKKMMFRIGKEGIKD